MTDFINTIDLLGDEATTESIINGTITEFNDNIIGSLGKGAFSYSESLTSVNLPNVTQVDGAFKYCKKLTSAKLPNLVEIIGQSTFDGCETLTSVDFPNLVTMSNSSTFRGCAALKSVNLPNVTVIGDTTFYSCAALVSIDLPKITRIGSNVFRGCAALTSLILRSTSVCTLSQTSSFDSTPFASGGTGGTVYVPQALITEYQNATNWSTLYAAGTCNFVAIEGSEYE